MSEPESIQLCTILSAYRLRLIPIYAAAISAAVIPSSSADNSWVSSYFSFTKVADPRLCPNLVVLGDY
tara:strand:+ start:346 stop:549 length:204 start_codon:yes stop_codon:yes gene_type:complete